MSTSFAARWTFSSVAQTLGFLFIVVLVPRSAASSPIAGVGITACTPEILVTGVSSATDAQDCGSSSAAGSASFATGFLSVDLTTAPGEGVMARAFLDDLITFTITGASSATVWVTMSGGWGGTYDYSVNADFRVEFDLMLSKPGASGFNRYNGWGVPNPAFNDPLVYTSAFTRLPSPPFTTPSGEVAGDYTFTTPWQITNGNYFLFASVKAEASNGADASITDPLIITLPDNVTYTSASGRVYSLAAPPDPGASPVPEPSTLLLLGGGLVAMARRRLARAGGSTSRRP
ncbi:MAG: PEP-CTERM sorting domain-containing protein [Acidobacteria bacterium]|nr:PEP-CTERM sorting domain-containing protein [Acidobacteriota bacterium]